MKKLFIILLITSIWVIPSFTQCAIDDADPGISGTTIANNCMNGTTTLFVNWTMLSQDFVATAPAGSWGIKIQMPATQVISVSSAANVSIASKFTWYFDSANNFLRGISNLDVNFGEAETVEVLIEGLSLVPCGSPALISTSIEIYANLPPPLGVPGSIPCPQAFNNLTIDDIKSSTAGVDVALPLELTKFALTTSDCDYVLLSWETANEINNYGFEIERRAGEKGNFKSIGFVKASESLVNTKSYAFNDDLLNVQNVNNLYYRLKQIDMDGKFTYSRTISSTRDCYKDIELNLSPNPAITNINIDFNGFKGDVDIKILSSDGKLVKSFTTNGRLPYDLSLLELNGGVYTLSAKANNTYITKRFIKID